MARSAVVTGSSSGIGRAIAVRLAADGFWVLLADIRRDPVTGGEPTVKLAPPELRGKGGRNQQLVLSALLELLTKTFSAPPTSPSPLAGLALLSGGTDGEDGPTDAAGAIVDAEVVERMRQQDLDPADFLAEQGAKGGVADHGCLR